MKIKFSFYLYIFLWTVYSLQGTLYSHGSVISVASLALVMVLSIYYYCYVNVRYKLPAPLKILSVLVGIWTLYGLEPILSRNGQSAFLVQPFSYLKSIYMSLLPVYAFYFFTKKGIITEDSLRRLFMLFLVLAIFSFYDYRATALNAVVGDREEVTNNAGYVVVSLLPLIPVFWRRPFWQYTLLGICLVFVLIGMKRGAIIAGALSAIWIISNSFRQARSVGKRKRWRNVLVRVVATIAVVSVVVYAIQYMLTTSDYFNWRLENTIEGNYSGREVMYDAYFNWFMSQDGVLRILFGNGANATLRYFSNFAHNDWLELLIDNGVIVTLLYAAYWLTMIAMLLRGKYGSTPMLMLGCFVIIYLLKTVVSMSYNSTTVYAACAIGYVFVNYQYREGNTSNCV